MTAPTRPPAVPGKARPSDCWLTPRSLIEALNPFDLDPCAMVHQPWRTAERMFTILDDGLTQPWVGPTWCNPPYSNPRPWLAKLADHGDGIALVNAATGTRWFHDYIWDRADAVLFLKGRLTFCLPDGTPAPASNPSPSVLVAYGTQNVAALRRYAREHGGRFIDLRVQRRAATAARTRRPR
jgi:phage N-6-adenine-methyltransferase